MAASPDRSVMRVLHVLHTSLPYVCGYSIRSDRILSVQRQMGIDVAVVTSAQQPDGRPDEVLNGVQHFRTPCPRLSRPPVREFQLMRALSRRLARILPDSRAELVHAHSPVLVGIPAYFAARRRGVPMVYEVRDLWENASVDRGKFAEGSVPYRAARALETWLLRRADAVVTIGETLRAELAGRTPRQVTVVANAVDTEFFQPVEPGPDWRQRWNPGGGPLIAYVGAFQPYEGLDVLVRAMRHLAADEPSVHLLIAGDGPQRAALERLAAEHRVRTRITFAGRVPHHQVKEIYAVADLLVYPRVLTRTTQLTTPLKPLEAMAMEKAVLASDLPAMRELIADGTTGELFVPGDEAHLAKRALELLRDAALCRRLGSEARAVIERERRWDRTVETYGPLYGTLLSARSERP